jgi:hypothetical protein
MSPITAKLKCPPGKGKDGIESEPVAEVARHEDRDLEKIALRKAGQTIGGCYQQAKRIGRPI